MSALPRGTVACPFTDLEPLPRMVGVTPRGLGRASDIGDDAAPLADISGGVRPIRSEGASTPLPGRGEQRRA